MVPQGTQHYTFSSHWVWTLFMITVGITTLVWAISTIRTEKCAQLELLEFCCFELEPVTLLPWINCYQIRLQQMGSSQMSWLWWTLHGRNETFPSETQNLTKPNILRQNWSNSLHSAFLLAMLFNLWMCFDNWIKATPAGKEKTRTFEICPKSTNLLTASRSTIAELF